VGCGWLCWSTGVPGGNNLLEVFLIPSANLGVDRNGQSIEFVSRECEGLLITYRRES
jgi:hypothetical protein